MPDASLNTAAPTRRMAPIRAVYLWVLAVALTAVDVAGYADEQIGPVRGLALGAAVAYTVVGAVDRLHRHEQALVDFGAAQQAALEQNRRALVDPNFAPRGRAMPTDAP